MRRRGKVAILAALTMLGTGVFCQEGISEKNLFQIEAATTTGVVTADSLNVRKGPGTQYEPVLEENKQVYLFKNNEVKILDEKNNFYKVKFTYKKKNIVGYSNKAYIKLVLATEPASTPKPTTTAKPKATAAATQKPTTTAKPKATTAATQKPTTTTKPKATAAATQKPTTTAKPKATAAATAKPTTTKKPAVIEVELEENAVPNAGASNSGTTNSELKYTGKVTASALRVRKKASTNAEELTYNNKKVRLYKDNKVTILQQKNVSGVIWYYVKFTFEKKTLKGYVLSDYVGLTFKETVKGKISSKSKVYVRNSAGVSDDYLMDGGKKVTVKDGKGVTVLKEAKANSKKWFCVSFSYSGKKLKGYILANLVAFQAEQKAVTPSPTPTTTPIPTTTPKPTTIPKPLTASALPTVTTTVKPTSTPDSGDSVVPTAAPASQMRGEVNNGPLNVRVGAGKDYDRLVYKGEYVSLPIGHSVQIEKEVVGKTENWYYVKFVYNDVSMQGYVMAQYVTKKEELLIAGLG